MSEIHELARQARRETKQQTSEPIEMTWSFWTRIYQQIVDCDALKMPSR